MTPPLRILAVTAPTQSLLSPEPGDIDGHVLDIDVEGFEAGTEIEARVGGTVVRRTTAAARRLDGKVRAHLPIGMLGLPQSGSIVVRTSGDKPERIASVDYERSPVRVETRLTPLLVSCLPRSGSTLVMQTLARFDRVACGLRYPMETYAAAYYASAAKVLTDPADFEHSLRPNAIGGSFVSVGNPPHALIHDRPALSASAVASKEITQAAVRAAEAFYLTYADEAGRVTPTHFAEKEFVRPGPVDVIGELWPNTVRLVLVRDLRDVVASRLAFAESDPAADPEPAAVVRGVIRGADKLAELIESRGRAIRYEDLVDDPETVVRRAVGGLDLGSMGPPIEADELSANRMEKHRTSSGSSVGRWEGDIAHLVTEHPELVEANQRLGY